jgi:hypothetical protein
MQKRNLSKPFSIAGLILGEVYMFATILAPSRGGELHTLGGEIKRLIALAPFFGVFGALVGLGIGLLVSAVWPGKK